MAETIPALGLSAYFLGRRIAGQRRKTEKVPVAYLYNGVRLPKLPEWDRGTYPYAVIGYGGSQCGLYFSTSPIVFGKIEVVTDFYVELYHFKDAGNHYYYWNPNGPWENYWEGASFIPSHKAGAMTELNVFWANHDILNDDGTVNLAASEPIPVYE